MYWYFDSGILFICFDFFFISFIIFNSFLFYRYSFRHDHLCLVQGSLSVPLHPNAQRSPTVGLRLPAASVVHLVPFIIGAGPLDQ